MEKDLIEKAVGFEMNNLKNFPFSRLPIGLQLEVSDELRVKEKMELFNVTAGFRGYFARNGPFGRHVDLIGVYLEEKHQNVVIHPIGEDELPLPPNLSYSQKKLLLRKIRSCEKFFIRYAYLPSMDLVVSDEETTNYLADCFENLCIVSELWASDVEFPIFRQVLTALRFEVTDWARLYFEEKDFSECAEFLKSYLEKQLKNCKKVALIDWVGVEKFLEEIPGFQLEEDPTRVQDILKAFNKVDQDEPFDAPLYTEMKCFRRKIGQDEQGFVLVVKRVYN